MPSVGRKSDAGATGEFFEGKIVEGFPQLPLYPEVDILESYGFKGKYGAAFISEDKLSKVVNFYGNALKTLGWEATLKQISETNFQYDIKNAANEGKIIINTAADGETTAITVSVEPR